MNCYANMRLNKMLKDIGKLKAKVEATTDPSFIKGLDQIEYNNLITGLAALQKGYIETQHNVYLDCLERQIEEIKIFLSEAGFKV